MMSGLDVLNGGPGLLEPGLEHVRFHLDDLPGFPVPRSRVVVYHVSLDLLLSQGITQLISSDQKTAEIKGRRGNIPSVDKVSWSVIAPNTFSIGGVYYISSANFLIFSASKRNRDESTYSACLRTHRD